MFDMAEATAATADTIDKTSQKIGLSTQAYQEWDYVLSQNGMNIESMKTGLNKLNNTVDDTISGNEAAAEKFARLGISMDDLKGKSREEIFEMTIAGLQGMTDESERAAVANDLLGKSAVELAPLFNQTAESTDALRQKANDLGMVMSETAIKAGVDYTDAKDTLTRAFAGIKNSIGADLLPGFTSIANGLTALITGQKDAGQQLQAGVQELVGSISDIVPRVMELANTIIQTVAEIAPEVIGALVDGVVSALPQLTDAAVTRAV